MSPCFDTPLSHLTDIYFILSFISTFGIGAIQKYLKVMKLHYFNIMILGYILYSSLGEDWYQITYKLLLQCLCSWLKINKNMLFFWHLDETKKKKKRIITLT